MSDKPSSFADLFEADNKGQRDKRAKPPALGERVRGEVVQIGRDSVFIELQNQGAKRVSAYMHTQDLRGEDGELTVKVGDPIEAVVVEADPKANEYRLGRTMGRPQGLDELERAFAASLPVEGKVTGVNKGGLEVEVANARAFCPISQADKGFLADPKELIGRSLEFLITEFREGGKRIVVSRRALLERQGRERADETRAKLVVGATVRGTVTAVREFGAFVDLGGVEGLLPNGELSYDRSATAAGTLNPGDSVEVQVRELKDATDKRGEKIVKITLSLKALSSDPWDDVASQAPVGRV
ncbi:MAG: S1 RNA-binding domain-containing protein, partial [Polyangiales bacterium]